jgi:hypothetical protein
MNTRILSLAAIAALASTQSFAMTHSDWSVSAAYGILMPVDSKSTGWEATYSNGALTITEAKQKNANYFDIGVSHAQSGFGLMYSATAKDVKFEITPANTNLSNLQGFIWKYNGVFATYKHPLGQMLDLTLAVGSVKQTFDNSVIASTAEVSKRDLGARVGIGAFYNLSKEASLKLGLSYNYFKEFNQAGYTSGTNVLTATPKFNASGLAASVALVYAM